VSVDLHIGSIVTLYDLQDEEAVIGL